MVDGIATALIPLTTRCNFRLHPVVTQITKAIGVPKPSARKTLIFLVVGNVPMTFQRQLPKSGQQDTGGTG